jgi:hypothetical protein
MTGIIFGEPIVVKRLRAIGHRQVSRFIELCERTWRSAPPNTLASHIAHAHRRSNDMNTTSTASHRFGEEKSDADRVGHKALEGAGLGAGLGGLLGSLLAVIATLTASVMLPGIGMLAALPLALLGASAGAANGGLVGALIGWGIPQERMSVA